MKYDFDVLICYSTETGREQASTLKDGLERYGFFSLTFDDPQVAGKRPAVCVAVYTQGFFESACVASLEDALRDNLSVVPVWFNNCKDWQMPEELPQCLSGIRKMQVSTLDFLGTDFNLSMDKMIQRFPSVVQDRGRRIRETLKTEDWVSLLADDPHFADNPVLVRRNVLSNLSDIEWAYLITIHPELFGRCDWNLIKRNSYVIRTLLCFKPELVARVDSRLLTGDDWAAILILHPELAGRCPWRKLSPLQWMNLLSVHPEFAIHCDFSGGLGHEISRHDYCTQYPEFPCPLTLLLLRHPEFADRCWLRLLSRKKIAKLVIHHPSLTRSFNISKLGGEYWLEILNERPELAEYCDWGQLGEDFNWCSLLKSHPEFSEHCKWENLTDNDWIYLLAERPEFADRRDWSERLCGFVEDLLAQHPEFVDRCDLASLGATRWNRLLQALPQARAWCDINALDVDDAMKILVEHPEFEKDVDWMRLQRASGELWATLLDQHPQFTCHCNVNSFNADDALLLLSKHPGLGEKFQWERLTGVCEWKWVNLIREQPKFKDRCPEEIRHKVNRCQGDAKNTLIDVFLCGIPDAEELSDRLLKSLEQRGYSVHKSMSREFNDDERCALEESRFFLLLRANGIFDNVADSKDSVRLQIEQAIRQDKRIIVVAPTNEEWRYDGKLPDSIIGIETEQVKNIDVGDLYETKVDALVRESMIQSRGALSMQYDVFISYRRSTGARFARRVQQRLKELGYVAFLDYDSILNGKYDAVIRNAVRSAPVFLMLLTEHSLDRCADSGDWVAEEIRMAHDLGKCIVPISPSDQDVSLPSGLPADMRWIEALDRHVVDVSGQSFNASIAAIEMCFPSQLRDKISEIQNLLLGATDIWGQRCGCDWNELLLKFPDLIDLCPFSERQGVSPDVLVVHPELSSKLGVRFDEFYECEDFWAELLEKHPEFADQCDLSRLNSRGWASLIRNRAEYEPQCDWTKIELSDQAWVLAKRPEYAEKCALDDFDVSDWTVALKGQPQLVTYCDKKRVMAELKRQYLQCAQNVADFLAVIPEMAYEMDWRKIQGANTSYDGFFWAYLLAARPELKELGNLGSLYGTDSRDSFDADMENAWAYLLEAQPQFEDLCDWARLSEDDWEAIGHVLPDMASRHMRCRGDHYRAERKWGMKTLKALSREEWRGLLKKQPELKPLFDELQASVAINRIHISQDGARNLCDDYMIERKLAFMFNNKFEAAVGEHITFSPWAPSHRLQMKRITFKGDVKSEAYDVEHNELTYPDRGAAWISARDVELIPGLLSDNIS